MKLRNLLLTSIVGSQIILAGAFAGTNKINKLEINDLRVELEERCLNVENCDLSEANMVVDKMELNHQNKLVESDIKVGLRGIKLDPIEVIKNIQDAGVKVVRITIKSGDKVLGVVTDSLDTISELPIVSAAIKDGKKSITFVVEGTYKGAKKITTVTVKVVKKLGLVKPVKIVFKTTFRIAKELTTGTMLVVNAFFNTKPVVIIIDGIEYVTNIKPIRYVLDGSIYIVDTTFDVTMEATEVLLKGVWKGVKYTAKGAMFVVGVPIMLLKWLLGGLF